MEPVARPSYIAIARIVRTRGNRGEVLADLYTDFPDRFNLLQEVWLEFNDGHRQYMKLEDTWEHKGKRVLKLAGVDTISSAKELVGCWIEIPYEQAVLLPEDSYFDHDLIGCLVTDIGGNEVGVVTNILRIAENSQLVVQASDHECLIPLVKQICKKISIADKKILVDPPQGLLDLNK